MKKMNFPVVLLFILVATIGNKVMAQPFTLDDKLKPLRLDAENDPENEGVKLTGSKGSADTAGRYFYVKGISMFQPIDVLLMTENPAQELELEIYKSNWEKRERRHTTDKDGVAQARFRTYGDFGIKVKAKYGAVPYTMVVVGGKSIRPPLESPFVSKNETGKASAEKEKNTPAKKEDDKSSSTSTLLLVLLGVIAILLAVLLLILLKRKGNKKTGMFLLVVLLNLLPAIVPAQSGRAFMRDFRSIWDATGGNKKFRDLVENARKQRDDAIKKYDEYSKLYDWLFGGGCAVTLTPPGMPRIPSFCTRVVANYDTDGEYMNDSEEENNECATCFAESRMEFNKVRYLFSELSMIYTCTKEMADRAIAFGDNVSGVHAVSGLAWSNQRDKITQSVKDLEKAYDTKYIELLQRLQESLQQMSACEARFGMEDWYDRFGYMFYEFMEEKYKRSK